MKHTKKILSKFYKEVIAGNKTFEIRNEDDCRYEVGDVIELVEVEETNGPTGCKQLVEVTYRLDSKDFSVGIKDGYVVLGIKLIADKKINYTYKGQKVKLHGIFQQAEVLPPSMLVGGHNGGQLSAPIAVIENENGDFAHVYPYEIKGSDEE